MPDPTDPPYDTGEPPLDLIPEGPPEPFPVEEENRPERQAGGLFETAYGPERAILVGVGRPRKWARHEMDEHLAELALLAETAGAEVVETMTQGIDKIHPATFIGKGKVEFLAQRCEDLDVQTVIFDDDLSPIQQRNLERELNRKVVDRTLLILDIFARHARSNTAKTQVELAQLEYILPRLSGMWTHLSKQYGGIRTKGPGETQIETDRRLLRARISHLRNRLEAIGRQRETQRKRRKDTIRVALVGYTNVGKSTLLNALTGSDVLVEDKLFATLDSTVRSLTLGKTTVLFSDTVGFIRKLPAKLVASFKSTLDEVVEADVIMHVVDVSHPAYLEQMEVVQKTLQDIHADGKNTIMVFNKIDLAGSLGMISALRERWPQSVFISAARSINLNELLDMVRDIAEQSVDSWRFRIQPADYRALAELHRDAEVLEEEHDELGITVRCRIKPQLRDRMLKVYEGVISIVEDGDGQ
jgi:GTP-binding protein HflX